MKIADYLRELRTTIDGIVCHEEAKSKVNFKVYMHRHFRIEFVLWIGIFINKFRIKRQTFLSELCGAR